MFHRYLIGLLWYICMQKKDLWHQNLAECFWVLSQARICHFCCIYGGASVDSVGHCGWRDLAPGL